MVWVIGIICSLVGVAAGFCLDCIHEWRQKSKAGLTGRAHALVSSLGTAVRQFNGHYYTSESPTQNFRITSHIYQHADGEVIGTSFRENPKCYGDKDLARTLPNGGACFTRISSAFICPGADAETARNNLLGILPRASLIIIPDGFFLTCIDGIFCKFPDETYLAFATFPKVGTQEQNRGIIFYGNIAKAFFDYYNALKLQYSGN